MSVQESAIKKVMWRLLPFVLICYIVAQIDRINIGFAALEMNAELALSAEVFGLLSGIFFIGYFLFEVPSNMILHKVGARLWIARIMITWGVHYCINRICPICNSFIYFTFLVRGCRSRIFTRDSFIFNVLV